jgi:predicted MFS family arabinose efflux permease
MRIETRVMSLTTRRVPIGTRLVESLHWRSAVERMVGTTATCVTSSVIEMHAVGSKNGAESESASSRNNAMRETMIIMVLTLTNLTGSAPQIEGIIQEESKLIPVT